MKYLPLVFMCALVTSCYGQHNIETKGFHGASAHAGAGYKGACKAALLACQWPDEYPGSDEPGVGYKEGQAAAEDADCHDD